MKFVAFHNLGCKVNAYELEVVQQNFVKNGYLVVPFDQKADIYIINTCTVTSIADRKSRQMLHRAKALNPDALVVALGCYVETGRDVLLKDDLVDLCIGNHEKNRTINIIEEYLQSRENGKNTGNDTDKKIIATDIGKVSGYEDMMLSGKGMRTRADIKVQDGCNQFCTYCLIPYARGRVRSRSIDDTVKEISGLASGGYSEFVLTGIHLSAYGSDNGSSLSELVCAVSEIRGVKRLRMSSLEPRVMTEDFIKTISDIPAICPHFHLSLQSGCDETLKRMNRHYTTEEYAKSVKMIRRYFEKPAITTDIIAGFPGETEEEFEKTKVFAREMDFYEIHVFPYSVRKGTAAAKLKDQLDNKTKKERASELLKITSEQKKRYEEGLSGTEEELLIEEEIMIRGKTYYKGHLKRYAEAVVSSGSDEEMKGAILRGKCEYRDGELTLVNSVKMG